MAQGGSVVREDDLLEGIYVEHHRRDQAGGKRIGQAFLETERAGLLGGWIGRGKDVLDLGCRDGTLTRHFREGNRVVGADIDRRALESARTQYGIEVQRVNLNASLPFPNARFDAVVRSEEHTSELQSHHDLVCRLLLEKKNY